MNPNVFAKSSRTLIILSLILVSLMGVGFDSQPALKNQADEIDVALKAIEKRITNGDHLNFQQPDIQSALAKLGKLSVDISKMSIHADSTHSAPENAIITSVGAQYMAQYFAFHVIYARAAHALSANTPDFNYHVLDPYTLKLMPSTALDLLKQKPFNSRHLNTKVMEFFVNSQDKQLAEFFALTSPKDELTYAKLIQFSALRENFTNLWAIQRLTTNEIPTQKVNSCAPELLSFRSPPSGDLKESEPYSELTASDRYTGLSTLVTSAFQKTLALPFITQENYYEVLTKTLSGTDEFKTYISGVDPKAVSKWLNDAAGTVAKVEQTDWAGNAKNSEKVLGGSTLISDKLNTGEIARRMSETVFERRENAAIAQITSIAGANIKVKDLDAIQRKAKDIIDAAYRTQWITQSEQQLSASISGLDQSNLKNQEATVRAKAKIDDTVTLASFLMPAMHDYDLIDRAMGAPVETASEAQQAQSMGMTVYLRPQFKLSIADAETFKAYLIKEIQNKSGLWTSLEKNSNAMLLLNSFFVKVAEEFTKKAEAMKPNGPDQTARLLLSVAQSNASSLIQTAAPAKKIGLLKLVAQTLDFSSVMGLAATSGNFFSALSQKNSDEAPQKLLQQSFDTINLFGAKNPTDLSPHTEQQEDLASIVLGQGYELNPLLGVRTADGATVLERIYREALETNPKGQLDYGIADRIVYEGIQTAAKDIQGKLEDFCQANVANPARDLRFRRLFRSASHLRQTLLRSKGAGNSDDLAKFDASLTKKTQTVAEKVIEKIVKPLFMVLTAAMVLVLIISLLNPMTTIPALATLMVIANFGMIGLSVVSSYFEVSNQFFEQPAQVKYQEALASAQVSSEEPFDQWDQLKSSGLIATVTNRATADQAKQALVRSQLMEIPQLAMNAWIGYGGLKQIASNIGLTGMLKYKELAGAEMPGWAEKTAAPAPKTFSENLRDVGTKEAVKQKASQYVGTLKSVLGLNPAFGAYTSEEALNALKVALTRVLSLDSKELLPEVKLYRDFLRARLKVTNQISSVTALEDGTTINAPKTVLDEDMPDFIKNNANLQSYEDTGVKTADGAGQISNSTGKPLDHVRKFWTETPQIQGGFSWKEMLENPQFLKWRLIPKSALKAARLGNFANWVREYGNVVKLIDLYRGELISQKLQAFDGLASKMENLSAHGMSTEEVLRNLDPQEMALLQEAARGPRFLAYGYWSAKSAEQTAGALPLRNSVSVFDTYNKMIESLKPIDWAPPSNAPHASSPEQADVQNFYRLTRTLDAEPGTTSDYKGKTIEGEIEQNLYRRAN